jgi:hypothetical protein
MEEAVIPFKHFYKVRERNNINDVVKVSILYPKMVSDEEEDDLYQPVSLKELK